jgi:hypothetical protein
MKQQNTIPSNQFSHVRMLLPAVAVIAFVAMIAIAEFQIRSSPNWPPPLRHELGGWQADDPPLWNLAGGLNLPATIPIVWMGALSDGFTYALDDHHLIIYLPWIFFVFWLWYFVASHLDWSATERGRNSLGRYLVFAGQMFITGELISVAIVIINQSPADHRLKTPAVVIACFWIWVVVTILGWINMIRRWNDKASAVN